MRSDSSGQHVSRKKSRPKPDRNTVAFHMAAFVTIDVEQAKFGHSANSIL